MALADLFRPKHKHSNSEVRAAAVAAMDEENVDILVDIAKRDRDVAIRKAAIGKIEDPAILVQVAEAQDESNLRDYATGLAVKIWLAEAISSEDITLAKGSFNHAATHGGDKAIAEIAGQAKLAEVRGQALARLEDERALMQVVRKSNRPEEWREALGRIADASLLRSIAIDEKRKEVATAALDRIEDVSMLDEVVAKAKNKSIRNKAKRIKAELTKKSAPDSKISDEDKRDQAERTQLARQVEDLAGADEWVASRAVVDETEARWQELGDGGNTKIAKRFSKALARYNKNYDIYGKAALQAAQKVVQSESVPTPPPLPDPPDPEEAAEVVASEPVVTATSTESQEDRKAAEEDKRLDNQDDLERLCEQLEELHEMGQMKGFDRTLKDTDRDRRKVGALPKAVEESLRERYEEARRKAVIRLGELREADDWKRWAAVPKMEALVARAKTLLEDNEGKRRGEALKTLQSEWKALGAAPREKGEELWKVFKATCDEVYEKVKGEREARNEEQRENLVKKEELCERAEALQSSTEWQETSELLKELQSEWKSVGPVPRRKSDGLWKRFRSACDAFFEARAPHLEEKFSEEAENLEAKTLLIKEVESLAAQECETPEALQEQLAAVREMQSRWREIGRVAHKEFTAINAAYKEACDKVYAKRELLTKAEREAEAAVIASLEEQISECADAGWDSDAADVAKKVVAIRQGYRDLDANIEGYEELGARVATLIRSQLESEPAAYKGTALDPERSAAAREKIIAKAEEIAPEPEDNEGKSPEEIADKIREALADRALGGVLSKTAGRPAPEIVAELREQWSEIGPVPGAPGTELVARFDAVCERILAL